MDVMILEWRAIGVREPVSNFSVNLELNEITDLRHVGSIVS